MHGPWRWWVDRFPAGPGAGARPQPAAPSLRAAVCRADEAAWAGKRVERFFRGALDFASAGDCNLVYLCGECVGEISLDRAALERCLPPGVIHVYHDFHPRHRFHFVSDPRRYAPGFSDNLGCFPSRDTAAVALLRTLLDAGSLRRFERTWRHDRGALSLISFSSASLVSPWLRVEFEGHEFGWLLVDAGRPVRDGQWYFVAPPSLDGGRRDGFFRSRDEAAVALLEALRRRYAESPRHFESDDDLGIPGSGAWNGVAATLMRRLEPAADTDGATPARSPREAA